MLLQLPVEQNMVLGRERDSRKLYGQLSKCHFVCLSASFVSFAVFPSEEINMYDCRLFQQKLWNYEVRYFPIAKMLWSMYSLAVNNRCGSFISQPNLQCQFLAAVFITAGNVEAAKRLVWRTSGSQPFLHKGYFPSRLTTSSLIIWKEPGFLQ